VSASVEPTDRTETLALGADAFFQKPFRFAQYMELGHLIKQLGDFSKRISLFRRLVLG
jgi:CheY-like chemotaxis protein